MPALVKRGRDKRFIIKLRQPNGDPYPSLPNANQVTVLLPKKDGTKLSINLDPIPAGKASAPYAGVLYTAHDAGKLGNLIMLLFDGSTNIHTVVLAWNTANPANQVVHNAPDDTVVPPAGTVHLQNGFNTFQKVSIVAPAEAGQLLVLLPKADTLLLKQGNLLSIEVLPDLGDDDIGEQNGITVPNALSVAD